MGMTDRTPPPTLLDRIVESQSNYWVGIAVDVAASVAFLGIGLSRLSDQITVHDKPVSPRGTLATRSRD